MNRGVLVLVLYVGLAWGVRVYDHECAAWDDTNCYRFTGNYEIANFTCTADGHGETFSFNCTHPQWDKSIENDDFLLLHFNEIWYTPFVVAELSITDPKKIQKGPGVGMRVSADGSLQISLE